MRIIGTFAQNIQKLCDSDGKSVKAQDLQSHGHGWVRGLIGHGNELYRGVHNVHI